MRRLPTGSGAIIPARLFLSALLLCAPMADAQVCMPGTSTVQKPGPSTTLFANPMYSCPTNYYVSHPSDTPAGNDSNPGTQAAPWATLAHANAAMTNGTPACINVLAGSAAYAGVTVTKGGNSATAAGYMVYRCMSLDGCIITPNAGVNSSSAFFQSAATGIANYTIYDGFVSTGTSAVNSVGIEITGSTTGGNTPGSHHNWVFNSILSGFGTSGIAFANGDYTYAYHNTLHNNANATSCDNGAQGSGLADNVPQDVSRLGSAYTPTADDSTNPNPLIGSLIKSGSTFFHKSYSWNVAYNNYISPCSGSTTSDTDGNGIIFDTFAASGGNVVDYPDQSLALGNVVYNNGGGGVHIFIAANITVANTTCYNNYLDPDDAATGRGCIDDNTSTGGNTFVNNALIGLATASTGCSYSPTSTPYTQWESAGSYGANGSADTFSHNVSFMAGAAGCNGENPVYNTDVGLYSCTSNKCATNPAWVNVGGASTGTESTPPTNVNFVPGSASPLLGYYQAEPFLVSSITYSGACSGTLVICP